MRPNVTGNISQIIKNTDGVYEGNLVHYFKVIFETAPNLRHPYHNFRHMLHVTWLCYQACLFYPMDLGAYGKRRLLIAALFHDYDHLGTLGNDAVNIERAIAGFNRHALRADRPWQDEISSLIRATEFPHKVPSDELTLPEQILRDADLCQVFSPSWIQQVVFGLAAEWGKTPLEVLRMQHPFLSHMSFSTEWANALYTKEVIEEKIAEAIALLELLETK